MRRLIGLRPLNVTQENFGSNPNVHPTRRSSVWSESSAWNRDVVGSNPTVETNLTENNMRKLLSIATILMLATSVNAQEAVTLTWKNATTNTDGTPLTDLIHTNVYYGICTAGDLPTSPNVEQVPGPDETWTTPELAAGEWCFRASHVNSAGMESVKSNLAVKIVNDTTTTEPEPPVDLAVQPENQSAYMISQTANMLVLVPVGTVPAGTPCDSTMSANGHYLVDRDAVVYVGTVRPATVFAECS